MADQQVFGEKVLCKIIERLVGRSKLICGCNPGDTRNLVHILHAAH